MKIHFSYSKTVGHHEDDTQPKQISFTTRPVYLIAAPVVTVWALKKVVRKVSKR